MMELLSLDNLLTLVMLVVLQAVLGFDNLLYISIESKRAPIDSQASVRKWGIGIAVGLRIILLFVIMRLIALVDDELFSIHIPQVIDATFNLHALIVLLGGVFILYTSLKEILHMMSLEELDAEQGQQRSAFNVISMIVVMNVIFSFDSILSAMALSDVYAVMATAIIIGGLLMIWLADKVSDFLKKNRMYEVLGLFILFLVGVMLLSEGGHLAHMSLFGNAITSMSKVNFYFILAVLALCDVVQGRYQRKLDRAKKQLLS